MRFLSAKASRNLSPPGKDLTFSSTVDTTESLRACPFFNPEISATFPSGSNLIEAQAFLDSLPVSGSAR